jgi:hypothetical protein
MSYTRCKQREKRGRKETKESKRAEESKEKEKPRPCISKIMVLKRKN